MLHLFNNEIPKSSGSNKTVAYLSISQPSSNSTRSKAESLLQSAKSNGFRCPSLQLPSYYSVISRLCLSSTLLHLPKSHPLSHDKVRSQKMEVKQLFKHKAKIHSLYIYPFYTYLIVKILVTQMQLTVRDVKKDSKKAIPLAKS